MSEAEATPSFQFYHISNTPRLPDTGANAVHYWASTDNKKLLEESGEKSLLITDWFGNSPLHYAAACSSYVCAEYIVNTYPDNHFFNQDKLTPAHIAAQKGDVRMLQIFQKAKFLMNDVTDCNWTILHFAVLYGHLEAVRFILENCDNSMLYILTDGMETILNTYQRKDLKFCSALDIAKIMKNEEMINLLNQFHALPSLHSSVMNQNYRAFSYFLFSPHKANLNYTAKYRHCTALHIAAAYDYYEICHSLLMCGASADILDEDGYSALDIALIHNAKNSAQLILPKCSQERVSAAYCIALDLKITWIFDNPVKFNDEYVDKNGDPIIIHFIKRLTPETYTDGTKKILKSFESKDSQYLQKSRDQYGATAFHYAAASEIPYIHQFYLGKIKDMEEPLLDLNNFTTLTYCILSNNKKSFQLINKRFNNDEDVFGMTPALYGLINGMSNQESPLLNRDSFIKLGYNIKVKELYEFINKPRLDSERTIFNYKTNETTTIQCPLINVYDKAFLDIFNINQSKRMNQFFKKTDGSLYGCSFIYIATLFTKAKKKKDDIDYFNAILGMAHLMELDNLINCADKSMRSPLMFAAMCRRYQHVLQLINYGADIRSRDNEGNSIWHYVDTESVFKSIYESRAGDVSITVDDVNNKGETPLHIACKNGSQQVLKCFVQIISDQKILTIADKEGNTPLDNSLLSNSNSCIEFLHSKGIENRLIKAIHSGCTVEEVEKLISHGYPVNSSDRMKSTPLHAAVQMKNISIILYLMQKGADVNAMDMNMKTPLHIAAQLGCLDIIKILLRNKIDMTSISLDNQPFLFASDKNIKEFLFNYWKRQYYGYRFFENFIFMSQNTLGVIDFIFRNPLFSQETNHPDFDKILTKTLTKIIFVWKKINFMRPKNQKPFNFMFSLHHLLLIITTIDLTNYQDLVKKALIKEGYTTDPQKSLYLTFLYLYPLRLISYLSKFLEKVPSHLLQGVDDIEIVKNNIFSHINSQVNENNKVFEQVNGKINEFLETSKIKLPQRIFENPQIQQSNHIIISTTIKIDEVSYEPTCIFYPQFSMYLKSFYGSQFVLPRYIPFHNGNIIRVILFSNNTVAFVSTKDSNVYLVLPVELVFIKPLKSEDILVTTPIGSFNMVKYINPQAPNLSEIANSILINALFYAQDTCVEYDEGESLMAETNKEKNTYMCLVIYQLIGKKTIDLRMVILKADAINECFDLIQAHISNSIPSGLVFLRVIPHLAGGSDNTIVFV